MPFAPVRTLPETLDDPHFRFRNMVATDSRGWDHIGNPIAFADERSTTRLELPEIGEHSRQILEAAGYTPAEIGKLAAEGAVRLG